MHTDTVNLNPSLLPLSQLALSRFDGVGGYGVIPNPHDPNVIEAVLASGKEVIVDVGLIYDAWLRTDHPEARLNGSSGHSMLVVGYDRRDTTNPYFILKNSWGPTPADVGWGGFQRGSYEFVRRAAYSGCYIMELAHDQAGPAPIDPATYSPSTLAAVLTRGRLPLPQCVRLGLDLTAALQYLHERGLIHRDIKPSNIVFANSRAKLADIGLVTGVISKGKDPSLVGTEGFIPPEGPGTIAADIYGLRKFLYETLTGRDRHEFPALSGTLMASAEPNLASFNEIVLKACHPDSNQRYAAVSSLHLDLLRLSQQLPA